MEIRTLLWLSTFQCILLYYFRMKRAISFYHYRVIASASYTKCNQTETMTQCPFHNDIKWHLTETLLLGQ